MHAKDKEKNGKGKEETPTKNSDNGTKETEVEPSE